MLQSVAPATGQTASASLSEKAQQQVSASFASSSDGKIHPRLLHKMTAACCRIVDETETKIGVGLLFRPPSAPASKADAAGFNQICILTSSTLIPSIQAAVGASFEFQDPSDAMAERPRLVLLRNNLQSTEGVVTDE
jgi:hypothetical protein